MKRTRIGRFGGYITYHPNMVLADDVLEKIRMYMVEGSVIEGAENQTMIIDFTYVGGDLAMFTRVGVIMDGGDWEEVPGYILIRKNSDDTLYIHVPDNDTRKLFSDTQSALRTDMDDESVNVFSGYADSIVDDESKWQRWEDTAGAMDTDDFIA